MTFLSDRIQDARKQKRLTQEALGELLGISAQAVSQWETGATDPSIDLLPKLADALGVSLDFILRGAKAHLLRGPVRPWAFICHTEGTITAIVWALHASFGAAKIVSACIESGHAVITVFTQEEYAAVRRQFDGDDWQ